MNELIKYFNKKYGKEYGKISYPRTTIQIYKVYQAIKSYGIKDEELVKLLHNVKLPKPKSIEEKELYTDCLYNKDDSEIEIDTNNLTTKEYVDTSLKNKVDKVTGKGLSTVDFTTAYETKLKKLENYNDTTIKKNINDINTQLGDIAKKIENIGTGGSGNFLTMTLSETQILEMLGTSSNIEVTSITASSNYININEGETRKITYTILPSNATDKSVSFTSSDKTKVTVDSEGNIKAIKAGEAIITLTCSNGISTDCQVVVSEVSSIVSVSSISLNQISINLQPNETFTLVPTISPSDATNKSVIWNSNDTTKATVNNGVVTAIADGTAIITCTSVSNPTISATCNINVATVKGLTTVTDGLVHSYNLQGLNGESTTIEDSTGSVSMTMANFTDVASAKTAQGIKVDNSSARINQNAISPTSGNKYTIVIKLFGEYKKEQGYWGTSGIKLCNHNSTQYQYTDGAYLEGNLGYIGITDSTYQVVITTFDFDTKIINTYVDGNLIKTTDFSSNSKVVWTNKLALFDGYNTSNNVGVTISALLLYDKCVNETEAKTISDDLLDNSKYLDIDITNSILSESNRQNVIQEFSTNSTLANNILKSNTCTNGQISNIASMDANGFISSGYSILTDNHLMQNKKTICYAINVTDATTNQVITQDSSAETRIIYIENGKLYIRYVSVWILNGGGTINTGINTIIMTFNYFNNQYQLYINGIKCEYNHATNENIGIIDSSILYSLNNTELNIKDIIIFDDILEQERITSLHNELVSK